MGGRRFYLGVLIGFCLLGLGVFWLFQAAAAKPFQDAANALPQLEARARTLALPLKPEEFGPNPPVAASENAAPLFREAILALQQVRGGGRIHQAAIEALFPRSGVPDPAAALESLRPLQNALDKVRQAAQRPRLDFERDWSAEDEPQFGEYGPLRQLTLALSARGVAHHLQGSERAGTEDLRASLRVCRLLSSEPTLLALLVGVALESAVLRNYEAVLANAASEEQITALLKDVLGSPSFPSLRHALRGEFYIATLNLQSAERVERMLSGSEMIPGREDVKRRLFPEGVDRNTVARAYRAELMRLYVSAFEAVPEQAGEAALGRELDLRSRELQKSQNPAHLVPKILFPVFAQAGEPVEVLRARREVIHAFGQAMAYRRRTGRLPNSAREAGVRTVDPFDGKPLRLQTRGTRLVVYSIGPNRQDEGGAPMGEGYSGDIVAQFPFVARASQAGR